MYVHIFKIGNLLGKKQGGKTKKLKRLLRMAFGCEGGDTITLAAAWLFCILLIFFDSSPFSTY